MKRIQMIRQLLKYKYLKLHFNHLKQKLFTFNKIQNEDETLFNFKHERNRGDKCQFKFYFLFCAKFEFPALLSCVTNCKQSCVNSKQKQIRGKKLKCFCHENVFLYQISKSNSLNNCFWKWRNPIAFKKRRNFTNHWWSVAWVIRLFR